VGILDIFHVDATVFVELVGGADERIDALMSVFLPVGGVGDVTCPVFP